MDRQKALRDAEKLVSRGKYDAAIKKYRQVLDASPRDTNTLNRVGDLYVRTKRLDDAIELFHRAAQHFTDEGFFVKAIAIYKKILRLDPGQLDIYEKLAELYHRQGLNSEARVQYEVVADYHMKHGDVEAAIEAHRKIVEVVPDDAAHHLKLAELYQQAGRAEDALAQYHRIADLMLEDEKVGEALKVYRSALEVDASDLEFVKRAVHRLKDAGQRGAARELMAFAIERNEAAAELKIIDDRRGVEAEAAAAEEAAVDEAAATDEPGVDEPAPEADAPAEATAAEEAAEAAEEASDEKTAAEAVAADGDEARATEPAAIEEAIAEVAAEETSSAPEAAADDEDVYVLDEVDGAEAEFEIALPGGEPDVAPDDEAAPEPAAASAETEAGAEAAAEADDTIEIDLDELVDADQVIAEAVSVVEPVADEPAADEPAADEPATDESAIEVGLDAEAEPEVELDLEPDAEAEEVEVAAPTEVAIETPSEEAEEVAASPDDLMPAATTAAPGPPFEESEEIDLVAEATVLASYGLYGKAIDRLHELLAKQPDRLDVRERLVRVYIEQGSLERAASEATDLARRCFEADAEGVWANLRSTLREAGFRVERGEVLPPEPEPEPAPAPPAGTSPTPPALPPEAPPAASAEATTADAAPSIPAAEEGAAASDWLGAGPADAADVVAADDLFAEEDEFFDLAAELEEELSREGDLAEGELIPDIQEQSLDEIVEGFRKGVAEALSEEDFDTHYNLGIAYREMGLLDEAIGEFQLAAKDPRYLVDCCSLLAACFLDKGFPELALKWYERGLQSPAITEEESLGLRYELGSLYHRLGDRELAYTQYVEIYGANSNYRDVVAKLEELRNPPESG